MGAPVRAGGRAALGRRWRGLRLKDEPQPTGEPVRFPYDPEARYRTLPGTAWAGYLVHVSEACEDDTVHLITHAMTTVATMHEARCTGTIQAALAGKDLPPGEHLVDAAHVGAGLLVASRERQGVDLLGPPRPPVTWQAKLEGGYTADRFDIDREGERVRCPPGRPSSGWGRRVDQAGVPYVSAWFREAGWAACPAQFLRIRAGQARHLRLQPHAEYEVLKAAPRRLATKEVRRLYRRRAGIEGTISRAVRAFGLRRSRYRGLARTHLQHAATAAAVNLERLAGWFRAVPRVATRTSRLVALAAA